MKGGKYSSYSKHLGRDYHIDVFQPQNTPAFQIIMFGGSGKNKIEYQKRMTSLVPVFSRYLDRLEKEFQTMPFYFTYVTAPYDIDFLQLAGDVDIQEKWAGHVIDEILAILPSVPIYWIGYSGGFSLGWFGFEDSTLCFGGSALGGDQITNNIIIPPWWSEQIRLYYNLQDRVYQANNASIRQLVENEEACCYRTLQGKHNLDDYLKNESFSGLIRRAGFLFCRELS